MGKPALRLAEQSEKSLPRKIGFTVASLAALKCPAGKDRVYVYDAKTPGLAYCVTERDARSFYLVRKVNGRAQRVRLGGAEITIELARKQAQKLNGEIAQGLDPMDAKRSVRESDTLQELWDRYKREHLELRCTEKTRITDQSRFDTCFADWKSRRVLGITETAVRGLHTKLAQERGKTTANRAIQLLRRLLIWGKVKDNPVTHKFSFFREKSRERFLLPDEIPKFFAALDDEATNPLVRDFIYLCLWTGARRSNVASMRDDEINIASALWTIPSPKSKNAEPMPVHLAAPALKIVKQRMGHPSGYIFPGTGKRGHFVEPKSTWKAIVKRSGLTDIRLHDLRRTFGSWQVASGASLPVIGRSLGHKHASATQIYARLQLEPVRESVELATAALMKAGQRKAKRKRQ